MAEGLDAVIQRVGGAVEAEARALVDLDFRARRDVDRPAVARDVERFAEIRFGVAVYRRVPHDLATERKIADIVLPDLQRELALGRESEEARRMRERVFDQFRRNAVIGDDEKPGVFAGAGNGTGAN